MLNQISPMGSVMNSTSREAATKPKSSMVHLVCYLQQINVLFNLKTNTRRYDQILISHIPIETRNDAEAYFVSRRTTNGPNRNADVNSEDEEAEDEFDHFDNSEIHYEEVARPIKVEREEFEHFDDIYFLLCEENQPLPQPFEFKQEGDINQLANLILLCEDDFVFPQPKIAIIKQEIQDDFDVPFQETSADAGPELPGDGNQVNLIRVDHPN